MPGVVICTFDICKVACLNIAAGEDVSKHGHTGMSRILQS